MDNISLLEDKQRRLILIGKTGNGKSSTGNSILGRRGFNPQAGLNSVTRDGDLQSAQYGDLDLQVLDTPGLHDTEVQDDVIAERITRSLMVIHPGPHAIVLCLSCADRFTKAETEVYEALKEIFGEKMSSYLIIVFVRRDLLEEGSIRFEEQLQHHTELQKILAEVDNRYVLFDNRDNLSDDKKQEQRRLLMEMVAEVMRKNNGKCFVHKLFKEVDASFKAIVRLGTKALDIEESEDYARVVKPRACKAYDVEESGDYARVVEPSAGVYSEVATPASGGPASIASLISKFEAASASSGQAVGKVEPVSQAPKVPTRPQKPPRCGTKEEGRSAECDVSRVRVVPGDSFSCTDEDSPGMSFADKQRMVEAALKKRLARGELTEEEEEELQKVSKSFWAKIKDAMNKFSITSLEKCAVM